MLQGWSNWYSTEKLAEWQEQRKDACWTGPGAVLGEEEDKASLQVTSGPATLQAQHPDRHTDVSPVRHPDTPALAGTLTTLLKAPSVVQSNLHKLEIKLPLHWEAGKKKS